MFSDLNKGHKRVGSFAVLITAVFFSCFSIIFFIPLCLFLFFHLLFLINRKSLMKSIPGIILCFFPVVLVYAPIMLDLQLNSPIATNAVGSEGAGNIAGGIFNQLILLSSWPLYTDTPVQLFGYKAFYYKFEILLFLPLVLYLLLIKGRSKLEPLSTKIFNSICLVFLILIVVAAGPQDPFGFVYDTIVSLPFGRVLRSPDNKIGFAVVLCICILALITLPYFARAMPLLLVSMTIFQSYPLLLVK